MTSKNEPCVEGVRKGERRFRFLALHEQLSNNPFDPRTSSPQSWLTGGERERRMTAAF